MIKIVLIIVVDALLALSGFFIGRSMGEQGKIRTIDCNDRLMHMERSLQGCDMAARQFYNSAVEAEYELSKCQQAIEIMNDTKR